MAGDDRTLRVNGLSHAYRATTVLDDVSLTAATGQIVALLGPSGSGKTTLLRCIAGLEHPRRGVISLGTTTLLDVAEGTFVNPEHRGLGMVFQDGALFPHLDVGDNVGFGLPRPERRGPRVGEALEMVGLAGFERRNVASLSGGQRQRVALARALAPRPSALLLDEPFSNLDAVLRADLRAEVRDLLRAVSTTAIWVTHDRSEAFLVADSVAVLHKGRVVQQAPPRTLYDRPVDPWVAAFIGDVNLLEATATGRTARTVVGDIELAERHDGPVWVLVRPEQLVVDRQPSEPAWRVVAVDFEGHDHLVHLAGPVDDLVVRSRQAPFGVGDTVEVRPADSLRANAWPAPP